MKLSDAVKQKGRPFEIPDCCRDDLPSFFKEMGFTVGAEIGVQRGDFSKIICKAGLKLYGIDPWLAYADYVEPGVQDQGKMDEAMGVNIERMKGHDFIPIRKTSMEAVNDFKDESLDFVYIDGNHSFKYVTEDIFEWSKKVRRGGVISGHDYVIMANKNHNLHVKYVVDAYTAAMGLRNWYVLGRKERIEGELRDKYRSWFWIKT